MIPTLSQVCSLNSPFAMDVEDYAAGHCHSLEVWLTKLETYLREHTVEDVRRLLAEHEMSVPVASFQGGLLASQGEARREAWGLFHRRLQLCRDVGIGTLVVACDVPHPVLQTDVQRVLASLDQAAGAAGEAGVRLALEFQAGSALGNNLRTCVSLVGQVGSAHLGICLDVFHFYVGPSKTSDFAELNGGNLFHVQLSDIVERPREFAVDADRVMPGEGDIGVSELVRRLREIEYGGTVSLELMNPQIWQVPPRQFGEIGMTALRKILGQAEHG
ncbi:MAG: sugar phosphate isomerase/epimerase family protein [Pirellulaceae bacterium]|nr:sugar phosphate isomerase/epimerase [Planctomycetales bacterium]